MNPQLLYQEDPFTLEFETEVREVFPLPGGKSGAVLSRTYFYPTGGGQEHDTGEIGTARVVDVYKEGEPARTVHVLDREISPGPALARIDRERRLRHMQHHTAQHLLTQCFLRLFGLETVSANINGYSPSTLDLPAPSLTTEQLDRVEALANEMIYADLPVKAYFVPPQAVNDLPLRKQPKVKENIRVVEIEGFDWTPCGGTHSPTTGSLGMLKIIKTERQNEKTRVHFMAGRQALEYFREAHEIVTGLASGLSIQPRDLPAAFQRQAEALRAAERELQGLRALRVQLEAQALYDKGESAGGKRLISALFENRAGQELRSLGDELRKKPATAAVLAGLEAGKLSLVAACAEDSGLNARELLAELLAPLGGRGGGDPSLAQGGGTAEREQLEGFEAGALRLMKEKVS
jgi:alanyl-tRNA synthetase